VSKVAYNTKQTKSRTTARTQPFHHSIAAQKLSIVKRIVLIFLTNDEMLYSLVMILVDDISLGLPYTLYEHVSWLIPSQVDK